MHGSVGDAVIIEIEFTSTALILFILRNKMTKLK